MARIKKDQAGYVVREAFLRLLPLQIFGIVIVAVNTFIDSLITSRFLGTDALAAIGLFSPVASLLGISMVLITGIQILCSKYIGTGEGEKVVSIFSSGTVFLTAVSAAAAVLCLLFRNGLASALGAGGILHGLLADYILGFSLGIPGQILFGMMVFLPLNNDMKRSYAASVSMVVLDIVLDLVFAVVLHMGTLGMGIATSLSNVISAAIVYAGFIHQNKAVHLSLKNISFRELPAAAVYGLPNLMFTVGNTVKAYVLNATLLRVAGDPALAVMNVQNNICSIAGAVPLGAAGAFMALAGIYYGEEDRQSFVIVAEYALRLGVILAACIVALLMAGSSVIPSMFFTKGEAAWDISRRMLLLFPCWLVINIIIALLMRAYQCQGQAKLVNILSLAENLLIALIAAVSASLIGADGVWLAFPAGDLICLGVTAYFVRKFCGSLKLKSENWLRMSPQFGASPENCLEFALKDMQDVINISEKVVDFCRAGKIAEKTALLSGLAVEEMAGNVVQHGFEKDSKEHSVDVRIVIKEGKVTIRLRDDCKSFDPMERLKQFTPDDVTKNIGIRMIVRMTEEVFYQNNAGINTLLIRI